MPLNDREIYVVSAKAQGLSEKDALSYLKEHGHEISKKTYYRTLAKINSETLQRLYEIAKGQKERHRQRIDKLETIEHLLWDNYHTENDPTRRVRILKEIREMQVYLSAFDQGTAGVIEEVIKNFGKDHEDQTPSLSSLD